MPLLERKVFKRVKPPQDLDPNEELFYCKATQEVFRQYEQFFERVILCNSLVWTCSMTGKSNMTFQEAVESEESARNSLKTFSLALKKPLLYLASLTNRTRLNDMCDDVFNYVKDRYFVGEEVEVSFNGTKLFFAPEVSVADIRKIFCYWEIQYITYTERNKKTWEFEVHL